MILGIALLFTGAVTHLLNYERQTITLTGQSHVSHLEILEYHAHGWDPFPHHVELNVKTQDPITIWVNFTGAKTQVTPLNMQNDTTTITVFPQKTLKLSIVQPGMTTGTVRSALWCDSWNYAAVN